MSQELKAATLEPKAKEYRCGRCGRAYTSMMRLQHHVAAEHSPRTLKDIRTTRDITHRPQTGIEAPGHRA